ncbi:MAG TPA: glycosyltransferase family 2 protein [Pyrinomonadaceae bacterium]
MLCPRLDELPPPPAGKTGWPWTAETPPLIARQDSAWPRITVVTPSFNQGHLIEETIRSVLLQGYPNLEYIIVDGGSTDQTVEIIRRYEKWLAYWVSEPDRGQSHAINKGWERATGEVCAWLNSDDVYLRDTFEHAARAFINEPHICMVYGDAVLIDEASKVDGHLRTPEFSLRELLQMNFIPQPSTFLRRSVLTRTGLLDQSLHLCMDYDLWLRVALEGKVRHVGKTLSAMRMHAASKTCMQIVKMGVELADIASRFIEKPALPPEIRARGEHLLSRQRWVAGTMLWFSGEADAARKYVEATLINPTMLDAEDLAICVANAAIENDGTQAVERVHEFFRQFPADEGVRRLAEAWTLALSARVSPEHGDFYARVLRAVKVGRSYRLLRAVMPSVVARTIGSRAQRALLQLKRSLTHSPVGLSLSELS